MMKIFITGASGFIGGAVTRALIGRGDQVVAFGRSGRAPAGAEVVTGDPTQPGRWQEHVAACDAVIHLAGEPIAGRRWTEAHKRRILHSRIAGTRQIVEARPRVLVSTSAVDIYPFDESDRPCGEDVACGHTFLADVCCAWEDAAREAEPHGTHVALMRLGIVLGKGGGVLSKLAPAFRFFAGGPLGSGRQWFPWVHVDDVVGAYLHVLDQGLRGAYNVVSPEIVRQREFASMLGAAMKRPSWLPVPGPAVRLAVGELADYLLHGRKVVPAALGRAGYLFRRPVLADALAASL